MKKNAKQYLSLLAGLVLASGICFGQMRLPKLISNGMVLQRDATLKLWGWDKPGEKITATFKSMFGNFIWLLC